MNIRDMILTATPIGEANATPSRTIWEHINCWAENTVQNQLNRLCAEGLVKRKQQPIAGRKHTLMSFRWLYWRESAAQMKDAA